MADGPQLNIDVGTKDDAARLADRAILFAGQPARSLADIPLPGMRGTRSAAEISRLIDDIALPASETAS